MCGFYFVAFIDYIIAGKSSLDYTNLVPPSDYQKNEKITYEYFKYKRKCGKRQFTLSLP